MTTIAGKVVRGGELKSVGEKGYHKTTFAVSMGRNQDIVSCVSWFELADECANLVKGDRVLVCGNEESREYNGRIYKDLSVEFVLKYQPPKYEYKDDDFRDVSPDDCPF